MGTGTFTRLFLDPDRGSDSDMDIDGDVDVDMAPFPLPSPTPTPPSTPASSQLPVDVEESVNSTDVLAVCNSRLEVVDEGEEEEEEEEEDSTVYKNRKRKRVVSDAEDEPGHESCQYKPRKRSRNTKHKSHPMNAEGRPHPIGALPPCLTKRGGRRHSAINKNSKALRLEGVSDGTIWMGNAKGKKDEKMAADWVAELINTLGNNPKADIHNEACLGWIQSFKATASGTMLEQDVFLENSLRRLTQRYLAARSRGLAMTFLEIVYNIQVSSKVNR